MKNIEKQISKSIDEFKKGDIITRIEPTMIPNPWNFSPDEPRMIGDNKGIGVPYRFIQISNNKIYLTNLKSGAFTDLKYNFYKDGWAKYVDPKGGNIPLLNRSDGIKMIKGLNFN